MRRFGFGAATTLAVGALLMLSGCAETVAGDATGDHRPASEDTARPQSSASAQASPTTSAEQSGAPPTTTTAAAPACGPDQDAAIATALAKSPPSQQFPDEPWRFGGVTDFDPCADLSYARLELGGTVSSPMQLALFHRGEYTGNATWCAFGYTDVVSSDGRRIDVRYRWPRAGDANAAPTGEAYTAFVWDGDGVTMTADLPGELLEISGCQ